MLSVNACALVSCSASAELMVKGHEEAVPGTLAHPDTLERLRLRSLLMSVTSSICEQPESKTSVTART